VEEFREGVGMAKTFGTPIDIIYFPTAQTQKPIIAQDRFESGTEEGNVGAKKITNGKYTCLIESGGILCIDAVEICESEVGIN
jgi:hypothetical protein